MPSNSLIDVDMFKYIDGDFSPGTIAQAVSGAIALIENGTRLEITRENLKGLEQITEENRQKWGAKAGWGLAGAALFGPVGIAAGLFLGGKGKKYTVVCTMSDDRSFLAECSEDVYKKLLGMSLFKAKPPVLEIQPIQGSEPSTSTELPVDCPRCNAKLPPALVSGRTVCRNCGWSNKTK